MKCVNPKCKNAVTHHGILCPHCLAAARAKIVEIESQRGEQEVSEPNADYLSPRGAKGIRLTPGLHEPTWHGMLRSQPDGTTYRQRAANKSRQ